MKGNTRNEEEKRYRGNGGRERKERREPRKEGGMAGERKSVFFTLIRTGTAMRAASGCGVPIQRTGLRALGSGNGAMCVVPWIAANALLIEYYRYNIAYIRRETHPPPAKPTGSAIHSPCNFFLPPVFYFSFPPCIALTFCNIINI